MVAGDLQAQLVGAGREDELAQAGCFRLPAEAADPSVLQAMARPWISGNSGNCPSPLL